MRHRRKTVKLGRTAEHRNAMLANQTCSLIEHGRITTTLAKAKAVRPLAEKMVTLAKRGDLHARRRALALLHNNSTRTVKAVGKLFAEIAPRSATRNGGYTRVIKLGPRSSDSAPMAFIEWVDLNVGDQTTAEKESKNSKKAAKSSGSEEQKSQKK
jgi:large subunit ribosomal protein L17